MQSENRQRYLKALFYGPPGVGKSSLAGGLTNDDRMKDVLLVTAEGGDIVFEDNDRVLDPGNIDFLKLNKIEQLQKVFEFLKHHVAARDRNDMVQLEQLQRAVFGIPADQPAGRIRKYRSVILDSLTDIEAMNLDTVMGVDTKGFEVGNSDTPDWGVYRKNSNTIQAVVRSYRNLEINLIIICGQRWAQDEQKKFHYQPWLTGQLATKVQSFVDLVAYFVISGADPEKPDLRRLYIQPQSGVKFDAKCRRASIKRQYYDNPLMTDIMKDFGYI